ncbi:hypothetical protein Goshw_019463, partial [Gossypium schwendimanii]|nr:hypothetical protein [Gossypium aridum]MBA0870963.1 hypothetical protein [Gossypium schwendimanii]
CFAFIVGVNTVGNKVKQESRRNLIGVHPGPGGHGPSGYVPRGPDRCC